MVKNLLEKHTDWNVFLHILASEEIISTSRDYALSIVEDLERVIGQFDDSMKIINYDVKIPYLYVSTVFKKMINVINTEEVLGNISVFAKNLIITLESIDSNTGFVSEPVSIYDLERKLEAFDYIIKSFSEDDDETKDLLLRLCDCLVSIDRYDRMIWSHIIRKTS